MDPSLETPIHDEYRRFSPTKPRSNTTDTIVNSERREIQTGADNSSESSQVEKNESHNGEERRKGHRRSRTLGMVEPDLGSGHGHQRSQGERSRNRDTIPVGTKIEFTEQHGTPAKRAQAMSYVQSKFNYV